MLPRVILKLGPLNIHTFGLFVGLGIMLATIFTLRAAKERELPLDPILSMIAWGMVGAMVGARLVYVGLNFPAFASVPSRILHIQQGGLSLHGGILGGLVVILLLLRRNGLSFWNVADVMAVSLPLGIAIGRIGCDITGLPTDLPWGIVYDGVKLHPVQIYSFVTKLLLFLFLWRRRKDRAEGAIFLEFVILYSTIRYFLEYFRGGVLLWDMFTEAQLASILLAVMAGLVYAILFRAAGNDST